MQPGPAEEAEGPVNSGAAEGMFSFCLCAFVRDGELGGLRPWRSFQLCGNTAGSPDRQTLLTEVIFISDHTSARSESLNIFSPSVNESAQLCV